ncbi:MAG: hypothetical protein ACOYLO_18335 [Ferruginibacter sp.]
MKQYKNDPHPLTVKYPCPCAKCGAKLIRGSFAYYWPSSRKLFCPTCGEADFNFFLSSVADEEVYQGTGNPY